MRKATYTTVLMLAIAGAFLAGYLYNQRGGVKAAAPAGPRVLHYDCPMHPQHTSDRPGQCPACGMQLVARYEDTSPGDSARPMPALAQGAVEVGANTRQLIGVAVSPVERTSGTRTLRLVGRVAPDETRVYRLNAGVDGFIRQVSTVTTGSQVRKDQWLATFSAPDVRQPLQAYLVALGVVDRAAESGPQTPAQVTAAEASVGLATDRLQNLGMSTGQIEEIARTRELATAIKILAPADGFVVARNVAPGQKFDRDTEWFRIADLRQVWILADVFGADADDIRPGARARVSLPDRGRSFPARVSEVLPQFDPDSRTLKVRLETDNPGFLLRPDMFVDVELPIEFPPTIAVPVDAVLDSGLRKTVFIERGDGVFEPRQVRTGRRFDDRVEIVEGLAPGERIVTSGTFLIDSESRMKLALARVDARSLRDPICAMEVDERQARADGRTSEYGGRTYAFCSMDCKHRFDEAPTHRADPAARAGNQDASLARTLR
jgi:RND family efflux transporter MFP subunit